jgi:hypothetical protein
MVAAQTDAQTDGAVSHIRRMMLASQRLSQPANALFERVFLRGEREATVRVELGMTQDQYAQEQAAMLRALMVAATQ